MTETEAEDRIQALFDWWRTPESAIPLPFAPGFKFDSGLETMDSEQWLWWVRQNPHWGLVELLGLVASSTGGAVAFAATDPVSDLRHRISWLVRWSSESLLGIIETDQIVPKEN